MPNVLARDERRSDWQERNNVDTSMLCVPALEEASFSPGIKDHHRID